MPTPEQALEEMTRENQRLGLYDDPVPLPEPFAFITNESISRLRNGGNCKGSAPVHALRSSTAQIPLHSFSQLRDYGQQCAKAARAKALEEAAQWRLRQCQGRAGTISRLIAENEANAIRALAAAGVA